MNHSSFYQFPWLNRHVLDGSLNFFTENLLIYGRWVSSALSDAFAWMRRPQNTPILNHWQSSDMVQNTNLAIKGQSSPLLLAIFSQHSTVAHGYKLSNHKEIEGF
jgi:hypothetical protein